MMGSAGNNTTSSKAFTLLEVMLAVSLIVIVSGSAFAFYHNIIASRDKTLARMQRISQVQAVFDLLGRQLRSAIVIDADMQGSFNMDSTGMEFTTVTLPQVGYLEDGSLTQADALPPSFDVVLVEYRQMEGETEDGDTVVAGLGIRYDKLIFSDTVITADDYKLLSSIRFMNYRYYRGDLPDDVISAGISENGWQDTWSGPTLPTAVEVTLGFDPIEAGQEIDSYLEKNEYYRRVFYIPSKL